MHVDAVGAAILQATTKASAEPDACTNYSKVHAEPGGRQAAPKRSGFKKLT